MNDFDHLTGLLNMMTFQERARSILADDSLRAKGIVFLYFDLEEFKAFNERFGFQEGDIFLKRVGEEILSEFPGFYLSRFSDDHFVVVTEQRAEIEEKIVRIHENVHAYQKDINMELKAGIYVLEPEVYEVGLACDRARIACNYIKQKNDSIYYYYDKALSEKQKKKKYIIANLDRAIANGNIKVYYQPIIRTSTGKICGVESLVRWDDEQYGLMMPGEFMEVLEQCHMVQKLDIHVVQKVCENYRYLIRNNRDVVPICVNLSRLDFELCDIFSAIEGIVQETGMKRDLLRIELKESMFMQNADLLEKTIHQFRNHGYQVWMDGFGSGFSSLIILKEFEFDAIKINMDYYRDFAENRKSRVILRSFLDMAKQMNFLTVAVGVDSLEVYEELKNLGCDKMQGFFFEKPMAFEELLKLELWREEREDEAFYDFIGKINLLNLRPLDNLIDFPKDADISMQEMPFAIFKLKDRKIKYLQVTKEYRGVLESLGIGSLEASEELVNQNVAGRLDDLLKVCEESKRSGQVAVLDYMESGKICAMRVRYIATSEKEEQDAFLLLTLNVTELMRFSQHGFMDKGMQKLFKNLEFEGFVSLE